MRNQATIYLGLFLIAFGLYAAQLKKKQGSVVEVKPSTMVLTEEPSPTPSSQNRLQLLHEKVVLGSFFRNHVAGISLYPSSAPIKDFTVTLAGDEVYADQEADIHESWNSALDFLAGLIKQEPGLHVEISGYADESKPKEQKPVDFASSSLTFSYARAEWLAHYFERKHGIAIQKYFVLRGMGAVERGKKIELRFYYR